MKRRRGLSDEDRILWHAVASSATPLKGKEVPALPEVAAAQASAVTEQPVPPTAAAPAVRDSVRSHLKPVSQHIDQPTREKIAKGRIVIDGKVDLHGLTQSEAYSMLLGFLHQAQARDKRHVLVVTGKGASFGSEGVLKRAVPAWFATAPFRALVGGFHEASRHHGGAGALYVKIRRRGG
ncbi:Smr/MutS family protein [Tianweitania sediminis]|uniref:Smr/MutS family protein n=1 Tax=Tianweitania sediminis TaxID=1502156 RepID=A0A8J7QZY8_9HYPH|nr:Smr/MutS family protein [Tianweitania sediminis]MBP0437515.1 Smr/MutS family protein [Tianweitania sediminis]